MKNLRFIAIMSIVVTSCSNHDEPMPVAAVKPLIDKIISDNGFSRIIIYDTEGRVTKYVETFSEEEYFSDEKYIVTYSYPSDNLIKLHSEAKIIFNITQTFDGDIFLQDGRVSCFDAIFKEYNSGDLMRHNKYREEFTYAPNGQLNEITCTQWSEKGLDDWDYRHPWIWKIYYTWENDNLIEIGDSHGYSEPVYIYNYTYSTSTSGVQNIAPMFFHASPFQYYPLQLNGYFGAQSKNLVTELEFTKRSSTGAIWPFKWEYTYEVISNRIRSYTRTATCPPQYDGDKDIDVCIVVWAGWSPE